MYVTFLEALFLLVFLGLIQRVNSPALVQTVGRVGSQQCDWVSLSDVPQRQRSVLAARRYNVRLSWVTVDTTQRHSVSGPDTTIQSANDQPTTSLLDRQIDR